MPGINLLVCELSSTILRNAFDLYKEGPPCNAEGVQQDAFPRLRLFSDAPIGADLRQSLVDPMWVLG